MLSMFHHLSTSILLSCGWKILSYDKKAMISINRFDPMQDDKEL
jgi:hypothetical protein